MCCGLVTWLYNSVQYSIKSTHERAASIRANSSLEQIEGEAAAIGKAVADIHVNPELGNGFQVASSSDGAHQHRRKTNGRNDLQSREGGHQE